MLHVEALEDRSVPSGGEVLFQDDFNAENGGRDQGIYTNFAKWTVTRPSVDLIGNGGYDIYPGNGLYVDLAGFTNSGGQLTSKTNFELTPGDYVLQFDLGRNYDGTSYPATVSLGTVYREDFTRSIVLQFETITRLIRVDTATSGRLVFDQQGRTNSGHVIDNVKLTRQPGDIDMQSAQLLPGNAVQFTYETIGNPGPFQAGLYASIDATYDPSDVLITSQTVTPSPTNPQAPGTFNLPNPWTLDPTRPNLLVVADPSNQVQESNETNNSRVVGLPDIQVRTATTSDSRSVQFEYTISGTPSGEFDVGVYRSDRPDFTPSSFNPGRDRLVATRTFAGDALGTFPGVFTEQLQIDPTRPFVFVVADPLNQIVETVETNNSEDFEKRVLGVVTHGLIPFGRSGWFFPTWVRSMADSLESQQQYDRADPFYWIAESFRQTPDQTVLAGERMGRFIQGAINQMKSARPEAIIDLHLIGHSRGAVVISQALQWLQSSAANQQVSQAVRQGFTKMTMLDPHPALNTDPVQFSVGPSPRGPIAASFVKRFQADMQDPAPFFPGFTDQAEVFFQRTPTEQISSGGERFLNLWGWDGSMIANHSGTQTISVPLTGVYFSIKGSTVIINHNTITDWYMLTILPSLRLVP